MMTNDGQLDRVLADDDDNFDGDNLDDDERAALDLEIEASFAAEAAGELLDFADVLAELRTAQ